MPPKKQPTTPEKSTKAPKPITPSKTVVPSYVGSDSGLNLNIKGRPQSVVTYGNKVPQGDHVTAYRLIEEGLYAIIGALSTDEVEELSDLENRQSLRFKRSQLYDYLSAIVVLDLSKKDQLYIAMDQILVNYNQQDNRYKKTDIKKKAEEFHNDQNIYDKSYLASLESLDAQFRQNGEKLREVFQQTSRLLLTFYNRISRTSYHLIEGFTEGSGDIKIARRKIKEILDWYRPQQQINSAALVVKCSEVALVLNSLIHYPEITDSKKLEAHIKENQEEKKGTHNLPRNNEKQTLIEALVRHIHIFFAVYPQIEIIFNQNGELVDDFISKFIGQGTDKPNWPKFANNTDIKYIKDNVTQGLQKLKDDLTTNHYNEWKADQVKKGLDLDSSDDEPISTKPKSKIAPIYGAKLTDVVKTEEEYDDMIQELERLRKVRKIVEDNRDLIPGNVMSEIDKVAPFSARIPVVRDQQKVDEIGGR